jgi:predicted DNA-binding transcriptional regulator YafY
MPAPKSQTMRYRIINACLTNKQKQYPTLNELKEALASHDIDVGIRALESDLEAMRHDKRLGYHAPISFCRKNKGYYYTDPNYSIGNVPLTAAEIEAFQLVVESSKRFKGAQVMHHVEGIFDKLDKLLMQQLKTDRTSVSYPVVDFEKVPYSKGIEHFDQLYHGIIEQQPLHIRYKRFEQGTSKNHVFHPYLLKEYKFRWYLLGHSERRKRKLILALDRIESITVYKKLAFKPYKGIEVQKYFDHTIGVTINKTGVKEIRVWFSPAQGHYLKTQHLHASQEIVSDDSTGLIATFALIPNYELMQTLLAFCPECKVLEPASLQTQMKEKLLKSLELYEK